VGVSTESNFYVGFTENLSAGGLFVATYSMQPIGSKVDIALTLPGGETMSLRGEVRWQRAAADDGWPGMGIHFEDLSEQQEARMKRFLSFRAPLFYDD
jgi:uncharacterized protein (TIGR02266 family)